MTTTLAQPPNHAPASDESQHWDHGRLVVRSDGSDAGAMRLDLDLPDFDSADEVIHHVHLMIPGESSPLSPFDAVGENGRFIMSFFSADISNGELPETATVAWSGLGSQVRVKAVPVECATVVEDEESVHVSEVFSLAAEAPKQRPSLPTVVGGAVVLTLASLAFLIF